MLTKSMRKKSCPKSVFLGFCDEGLVPGVNPGRYTRSIKNKAYGLEGLGILRANPALKDYPKKLWELVMKGEKKRRNQQMDVVCALWIKGVIK
jgi:hypothetical protein